MLGRAPGSVQVVRPLRHGVIARLRSHPEDVPVLHQQDPPPLEPGAAAPGDRHSLRHHPGGAPRGSGTPPARRGPREVYLIQASMAAALGAGLPVAEPGASMIVDIGGGTTEVAVMFALRGGVFRVAAHRGDDMNQSIIQFLRRSYDLLIGERRAEDAKIKLGSAYPKGDDNEGMEVQGRDLLDGPAEDGGGPPPSRCARPCASRWRTS